MLIFILKAKMLSGHGLLQMGILPMGDQQEVVAVLPGNPDHKPLHLDFPSLPLLPPQQKLKLPCHHPPRIGIPSSLPVCT